MTEPAGISLGNDRDGPAISVALPGPKTNQGATDTANALVDPKSPTVIVAKKSCPTHTLPGEISSVADMRTSSFTDIDAPATNVVVPQQVDAVTLNEKTTGPAPATVNDQRNVVADPT